MPDDHAADKGSEKAACQAFCKVGTSFGTFATR